MGGHHRPDDKAWDTVVKEGHGDWQKQLGCAHVFDGTQTLFLCEINWISRALNP